MRRLTVGAWPLLQATVAAMAAWLIAQRVAGHEQPFFAPLATIAALNSLLGERGLTAIRLLIGVVVGIVVGELAVVSLHSGYVALAVAIFASMAIARALSGVRIVTMQAASSAVLTVVIADGDVGPHRLVDALIGVGVALVFSQILFSPEPVAFLRRAEAAALEGMADGLETWSSSCRLFRWRSSSQPRGRCVDARRVEPRHGGGRKPPVDQTRALSSLRLRSERIDEFARAQVLPFFKVQSR
jgi:uncharacterized membrane protein YgaE (UPF0421/DUF939 family)